MRSGAQTLVLLAAPLNVLILRALTDGPKQLTALRRETGFPAQTTLRAQLKRLVEIGTIQKQPRDQFPGVLDYELTPSGEELLFVAGVLEHWLSQAPDGPLSLESRASRAAIKALAEAWSTTMLRALAAGPLSLTELDDLISSLTYPSLERRLAALRLTGQIEPQPRSGSSTPYAVTEWLRRSVAPLVAAARWERRNRRHDTTPMGRIDIEAAFMLALPLLSLSTGMAGSCRLAVEISNGKKRSMAGVIVGVEDGGRISSCATNLQVIVDAWAAGSPSAWLAGLIESDTAGLELGGNGRLAGALLEGLHRTLFGAAARSTQLNLNHQ